MRHIVIGGDGFVGRQLCRDLLDIGQQVLIADIVRSDLDIYKRSEFIQCDVTDRRQLDKIPLGDGDVVYNLSARMLSPILPRAARHDFFYPVNFHGVENILSWMQSRGGRRLVQFTTDMVYGHTTVVPTTEDHPAVPLGPYGGSKLEAEKLCEQHRQRGFSISIMRPRLIIGPGRIGILGKLFRLIDLNLPVPMIGSGTHPYQFISVYDCASAARLAWQKGVPNGTYNLGSLNPPPVKVLLRRLIKEAGSKSILVPAPAALVKLTLSALDRLNMPLMDPEQYLIADEHCEISVERARIDLGWIPAHGDEDMLIAAYRSYRAEKELREGKRLVSGEVEPAHKHRPS